jgi:hypothetical protein
MLKLVKIGQICVCWTFSKKRYTISKRGVKSLKTDNFKPSKKNEMSKFILLKYSKNHSFVAFTNYFDINLKKYVKIWLFGTGLNNGLGLGLETQTPPLILNAPPYVKRPLILNIGYHIKHTPSY